MANNQPCSQDAFDIRSNSSCEIAFVFDVADQHFHELRVARREEDAKCVRADVIDDAQEPELKAQS